jgi:CRISPR-associated protein (Cas_Cmr5)
VSHERIDTGLAREAATVLEEIIAATAGDDGRLPPEVLTRLKGLPVMLLTSGVPATLAFYASRQGRDGVGSAYGIVGGALELRLREELGQPAGSDGVLGLLRHLADEPPAALQAAYARIGALADWLRRLAAAYDAEQRLGNG